MNDLPGTGTLTMAFQTVSRSGSWYEGDPEQRQVKKIFPLINKIQYMKDKYRYPGISVVDPDPDRIRNGIRIRIQKGKMSHKNRTKK